MTTTSTSGRISLRELGRRLNVGHSALSTAIHDGTLRAGIAFDHRGRAVVLDANAAADEWLRTHVPRVDHAARREVARQLAAPAPSSEDLYDRTLDTHVTSSELFQQRDALLTLVCALTKHSLADDPDPAALRQAIAARLLEVVEQHTTDDDAADLVEIAAEELESAIVLLRDAASDDYDDNTDESTEDEQP